MSTTTNTTNFTVRRCISQIFNVSFLVKQNKNNKYIFQVVWRGWRRRRTPVTVPVQSVVMKTQSKPGTFLYYHSNRHYSNCYYSNCYHSDRYHSTHYHSNRYYSDCTLSTVTKATATIATVTIETVTIAPITIVTNWNHDTQFIFVKKSRACTVNSTYILKLHRAVVFCVRLFKKCSRHPLLNTNHYRKTMSSYSDWFRCSIRRYSARYSTKGHSTKGFSTNAADVKCVVVNPLHNEDLIS